MLRGRHLGRKPIEKLNTWKVLRGDLVEICVGRDKGKQGRVVKLNRKKNRVHIEGLRLFRKTIKETEDTKGGVIYKEGPVHVSNVMIVDPTDSLPCKVAFKYTEEGDKVRVSKRTGNIIPRPESLSKPAMSGKKGERDTASKDALAITFDPASLVPELSEDVIGRILEKHQEKQKQDREDAFWEGMPEKYRDLKAVKEIEEKLLKDVLIDVP